MCFIGGSLVKLLLVPPGLLYMLVGEPDCSTPGSAAAAVLLKYLSS